MTIQEVYDAEHERVLSGFAPETRELPVAQNLAALSADFEARYAALRFDFDAQSKLIAEHKAALDRILEKMR